MWTNILDQKNLFCDTQTHSFHIFLIVNFNILSPRIMPWCLWFPWKKHHIIPRDYRQSGPRKDSQIYSFCSQRNQWILEAIWIYMNLYESIWIYMNLYESIWICMNLYESVWIYMNLYESIWIYMDLYESIWIWVPMNLYESPHRGTPCVIWKMSRASCAIARCDSVWWRSARWGSQGRRRIRDLRDIQGTKVGIEVDSRNPNQEKWGCHHQT